MTILRTGKRWTCSGQHIFFSFSEQEHRSHSCMKKIRKLIMISHITRNLENSKLLRFGNKVRHNGNYKVKFWVWGKWAMFWFEVHNDMNNALKKNTFVDVWAYAFLRHHEVWRASCCLLCVWFISLNYSLIFYPQLKILKATFTFEGKKSFFMRLIRI